MRQRQNKAKHHDDTAIQAIAKNGKAFIVKKTMRMAPSNLEEEEVISNVTTYNIQKEAIWTPLQCPYAIDGRQKGESTNRV